MTLFNQIQEDLKTAMKSGDKEKVQTLRFVTAEIKRFAVDNGTDRENISDEVTTNVLNKAVKTRKESIKVYLENNRQDLAEPEQKELEILKTYLPAELSDEEIKAIIDQVKSENPALQGGALMGKLMPLLKGKADPDRVKQLL